MGRPRKNVVLLASGELELSRWRMLVDLWGYRVLSALTVTEALEWLALEPECDLVLVQRHAGRVEPLKAFRPCAVVLFGCDQPAETSADAVEPLGAILQERVRHRVKMFTSRKRGPKSKAA